MQPVEGSFYRLIVAQAPVGIIFANPDGIIELWNAESEAIFGYGTEEAIGQSLDLLKAFPRYVTREIDACKAMGPSTGWI